MPICNKNRVLIYDLSEFMCIFVHDFGIETTFVESIKGNPVKFRNSTRCCKLQNPPNLPKGRLKKGKRIEQTHATGHFLNSSIEGSCFSPSGRLRGAPGRRSTTGVSQKTCLNLVNTFLLSGKYCKNKFVIFVTVVFHSFSLNLFYCFQ